MSPFNAWVFLKGLETLHIRMKAHSENALQLARFLEEQATVSRVYYPGLESHPQHQLASQQQTGFGGVLAFEVKGGQKAAWKIIDNTRMLSITANLGDTKTTITHPSTTTHGRLSEEERERMLKILDDYVAAGPTRPREEVERELREIREARRGGGRRTPSEDS